MPSTIYAVDEELFCFWAKDLKAEAVAFLESLDPEYFLYVAKQGLPHIGDKENEMRAGASMRLAFFHGSETLLLLLAAVVQAPKCPQAYLGQCQNVQLRKVLNAIDEGKPVLKFNHQLRDLSWHGIAFEIVRCSSVSPDRMSKTVELLERFWSELSAKNQDPTAIAEYNSLKHGFRVGHGGYQIQITFSPPGQLEDKPAEIKLGNHHFGTSFSVISQVGGDERSNRSRVAHIHHVGWKIENMGLSLELLWISIQNVVAYLRLYNDAPGRFLTPNFEAAEAKLPEVASDSYSISSPVAGACATTKDQLIDAAEKNRKQRMDKRPPSDG